MIYEENAQLFLFCLYQGRIKNGAFQRFKSIRRWFDTLTVDGYDSSINYHDIICLN